MTSRILSQNIIDRFVVLKLDKLPSDDYKYVIVDGKKHACVNAYDLKNCVAFEGNTLSDSNVVAFSM